MLISSTSLLLLYTRRSLHAHIIHISRLLLHFVVVTASNMPKLATNKIVDITYVFEDRCKERLDKNGSLSSLPKSLPDKLIETTHTKTIFFSIFRSIFSQLEYFEINIFFHWAQALTSRWQGSAVYQDIEASVHWFLFMWPFMSGVPWIGSRKSWGIIIDKCFPQISAVLVNIPPPIWETAKVWLGEDLKLKIPRPPKY